MTRSPQFTYGWEFWSGSSEGTRVSGLCRPDTGEASKTDGWKREREDAKRNGNHLDSETPLSVHQLPCKNILSDPLATKQPPRMLIAGIIALVKLEHCEADAPNLRHKYWWRLYTRLFPLSPNASFGKTELSKFLRPALPSCFRT